MASEAKTRTLQSLTEAHARTQAAIAKVGMDTVVYSDSGWRVREVIAHLAAWDEVLIEGFRAYREGSAFIAPGAEDYDAFNAQALAGRANLTADAVLAEWEANHNTLKAALEAIPDDRFEGEMTFPWGERGRIPDIMTGMAGHEDNHCDAILEAGRRAGGD